MTFNFDVLPRGSEGLVGTYTESGMYFGPLGPANLVLSGGGIPGYPDDGTGYLEMPDGLHGGMAFYFNPGRNFDLISFDAAPYGSFPAPPLEVIGYENQGMGQTVTNYFTVTSGNFQTFYPDSSFHNIYEVDVLNARWSLDSLVIGGVPEPTSGALFVIGTVAAISWSRVKGRHRPQA